jgi:hypothetical protein
MVDKTGMIYAFEKLMPLGGVDLKQMDTNINNHVL